MPDLTQPTRLMIFNESDLPGASSPGIVIGILTENGLKLGLSDGTEWLIFAPEVN